MPRKEIDRRGMKKLMWHEDVDSHQLSELFYKQRVQRGFLVDFDVATSICHTHLSKLSPHPTTGNEFPLPTLAFIIASVIHNRTVLTLRAYFIKDLVCISEESSVDVSLEDD